MAVASVGIATHGLGFVYPNGTRALESVDLAIPAGQRVAIVGQNGSGKSTLVRHFNGLLRATEGEVLIGGQRVGRRHVAELARLVGISFQNPDRQVFSSRVAAEVAFGARMIGVPEADVEARVAKALQDVGLEAERDANPYDLGFSRRKLLALASVLAMRTPVVVLDEPTTGQDLRGIQRISQAVANLAAEGRTVIAISHDMRFAAESFERILVMRGGRIVLDGTVSEAFAAESWPVLESTFLEPPLPARVGEQLGLPRPTPTEDEFVAALRARNE
jgi:energy-coupling factor transport system ATP-binding protein